jgi:putative ABC transport system substrate-binding protein
MKGLALEGGLHMQAQGILRRLNRRGFIAGVTMVGVSTAGLVVLGGCGLVPGQAPPKVPLIGYLNNNSADDPSQQVVISALREGFREQGLVEGRDLVIEFRFANGDNERLPVLVAELLGLGVRLIVCAGPTATGAARQVTDRMPLVMIAVGDPVTPGWVASLARPGGNVTGAAGFGVELSLKRIELLAAVAPAARRLAYLTNLSGVGQAGLEQEDLDAVAAAAERLGQHLLVLDLRTQAEIEPAFERARTWGMDAASIRNIVPFNTSRAALVTQAARSRMPAIASHSAWVGQGLLMSFNDSEPERGRAGARYAARILNGADPAELAIDRPKVYSLAVNRTTLANLGLTMPPDVAAQVTDWVT